MPGNSCQMCKGADDSLLNQVDNVFLFGNGPISQFYRRMDVVNDYSKVVEMISPNGERRVRLVMMYSPSKVMKDAELVKQIEDDLPLISRYLGLRPQYTKEKVQCQAI